jgi:hypothetical protein
MQGAVGVGGLLEVGYYGSATTNCFPAFDGNGNVAANDEYAAFGEPVRVTGVMARNNPFRFSTKSADDDPICFTMATAITSRHCAGKLQSGIQTRAGVGMQSVRIRFNQPRETRF